MDVPNTTTSTIPGDSGHSLARRYIGSALRHHGEDSATRGDVDGMVEFTMEIPDGTS